MLVVVLAFGEFVVVSRSESFGIYVVLGFSLKCNNSNSTLAVRSGFDLHRFLQVFGKENRKISCQGLDLNLGPADQKSVVLTITPWLLDKISGKYLRF